MLDKIPSPAPVQKGTTMNPERDTTNEGDDHIFFATTALLLHALYCSCIINSEATGT